MFVHAAPRLGRGIQRLIQGFLAEEFVCPVLGEVIIGGDVGEGARGRIEVAGVLGAGIARVKNEPVRWFHALGYLDGGMGGGDAGGTGRYEDWYEADTLDDFGCSGPFTWYVISSEIVVDRVVSGC